MPLERAFGDGVSPVCPSCGSLLFNQVPASTHGSPVLRYVCRGCGGGFTSDQLLKNLPPEEAQPWQ
jgi:hypothetical protein